MASGDTLIRFDGIKKSFGPKVIYTSLDLEIKEGENLVIIGGSGSGKSVLLKILIGLLEPDAGKVFFEDREITAMSENELIEVRADIAYVFQQAALFDSMSVADNIAYPLRAHLNLSHEELIAKVDLNLKRVGLPDSAHLMPSELSGGMRKRIGLARAIALEPRVILWDEPTTGLDPSNTRRISELILKMQEDLNVTSIIVTHDMGSALMVGDRIAMLHNHRIHQVVLKEDIKNEPDGSQIRDFIEGNLDL